MQASIDITVLRAESQSALFGKPNRAALTECSLDGRFRSFIVRVHRNHGIEPVISATPAYAAWNGLAFDWVIGPYDDTLSFDLQAEVDVDVEVVWLDTVRLAHLPAAAVAPWLESRLHALRQQTANPIIVMAWPLVPADRDALRHAAPSAIHFADLDVLACDLGSAWLDARTESISGTRLSNRAMLEVARELACCWLPACLLPPMKCVALDLDGTLYSGVLAEDGVTGIEVTDGHRALQQRLADCARAGILLSLVSRNERSDVEALFASRNDFALTLQDFSTVEFSWDEKSTALERIARRLRIGVDAIVFVDDNPGELVSAAAACPVVTVHADADGRTTAAALCHVAGLFRWQISGEDHLRARDLRAADERDALNRASASPEDYLRSLGVSLRYHVGARNLLPRASELTRKTNQFNLSLRRLNESEIARRLEQHPGNMIAIELSDRLSDSGVVAIVVGTCDDDTLHVEELSISCRALGRRIEDSMLTRALLLMADGRHPARVSFDVAEAVRNLPARQWLANFTGTKLAPGVRTISMSFGNVAAKPVSGAIAEVFSKPGLHS